MAAKYAVVVGASYVGIKAAQELASTLHGVHHVLLVESNSHFQHLFAFPRFAVATGVDTAKAFIPLRPGVFAASPEGSGSIVQARATRLTSEAVELDRDVLLDGESRRSIQYAFLVIATGTKLSPPSTLPGTAKKDGVTYLQKHVQQIVRSSNIVVIGAGAVGVQMATDIKELYPDKNVTLVHSRTQVMNAFHPQLHEIVRKRCEELGIAMKLGSRVKLPPGGYPTDGSSFTVDLEDGTQLPADFAIICTGQIPQSDILRTLSPSSINERRFIKVLPTLQISDHDHPNVFALGDIADTGAHKAARPGMGQAALVARNIMHLIKKEPLEDYAASDPPAIHMSLGIRKNVVFVNPPPGSNEPMVKHRDDGELDMGIHAVALSIRSGFSIQRSMSERLFVSGSDNGSVAWLGDAVALRHRSSSRAEALQNTYSLSWRRDKHQLGNMRRFFGLLLALTSFVLAAKDGPTIEETKFDSLPTNLFYFEDSDVVLVTGSSSRTAYRSDDAGVTWKPLNGPEKGDILEITRHPYNNQVAVVLGFEKVHWITKDQGKTWTEFTVPEQPTLARSPVVYHASDPNRIILLTATCFGFECMDSAYYTTNGFETEARLLRDDATMCIWAKSTNLFTTGQKDLDADQTLCVVKGSFTPFSSEYRLMISSDYFLTEELEPAMADGRTVSGVVNLAAVKSYLVAAAKSEGTTELAMYVSDDTLTWHRAEFGGHKLEEDAYTLLESTNYSMQIDVLNTKPTSPMGVLLTSNSNGTFFRKNIEHTNRNMRGFVDFEKIQNIQGIVMVNTVKNWAEIEKSWWADREVITQISFDDGRTWQPLSVGKSDQLHLHSVTEQRNAGRIFSSPAPGIVMGVGNVGKNLKTYEEGDLYVSDDAGLTWRLALQRPHLYEFGDQGAILVAIEDEETDEIKWSLNHGKDWTTAKLADFGIKDKIQPTALTTTPDSTSLKFVMTATKGRGSVLDHYIYSLDFENLDIPKCKEKDFEKWYARVDEKGEPTCIMGHTQMFRRRRADSECFVDEEFKDPLPVMEDCKCSIEDFECDYEQNFMWDAESQKCVPGGPLHAPEGKCEDNEGTYMGTSGYKLIPGNTCTRKGGVSLDDPIERDCKDTGGPAVTGISSEVTTFKGDKFLEYYYLERSESSSGEDETIIMRTDRREVYLSRDHGKKWYPVDTDDEEVVAVYPHQYLNDAVYLVTPSKTVYYSQNRGGTWHTFEAPERPSQDRVQILQFHPTQKDWLIWTGGREGQSIAHVSTKGGDDWQTLLRSVRKCQFVYREDRVGSDQLIYCEQYENQDSDAKINLLSSDDFFEHKKELKRDVISFATMAEYIVVAVRDQDHSSLKVDTSIDGQVFADAQFPSNFKVQHQQAYTVLDSSTHAVFLHVTVNNHEDSEYGSIIKSNSNGTSYVLAVNEVNRNGPGYVDFEKMLGLEGVAVINRVANAEDVDAGSSKKLKTYITHNDGADWALITRPVDPPKGKPFECKGTSDKCSLHLHGYTERSDPRDTFSSPSAVGLMIATGNVGEYLISKKDADTFATRDGGLTWTQILPGTWMWEYGDQGSIVVIVQEGEPTTQVMYSLDEGITWYPYEFSDTAMTVEDLTTVPSDTSRNFILWGRIRGDLTTINIDFSGLEERSRMCVLDEQDPNNSQSDYYLWEPKHPLSDDNCLFGHVAQYHRKKRDSKCYNGREIQHLHNIAKNCTCTRRDFECDYNYEKQSDGSCRLVPGLPPPDAAAICKTDKNIKEYYDVTGYRRIPLTTCEGGQELDYTARTRPCPGWEEDYERRHGIGAVGLFFAIMLPIGAAAGVGYWVWRNWDGKFGRIRLGGDGPGLGGYSAFDREAPWIKYPVMALSAVVAVIAAMPMVLGSLWKAVSTRLGRSGGGYTRPYTSRNSFQRARGDYAITDQDEGELLGEESDEEV
ncbi:hypothetical protein BAUCODRAFT_26843 [Baudoinia panamericana UAMH 10762]|uniref:Vacuolar protein sorting/targeting protein 10 n=1 Tax=Baudoinia panamericana (strain UAMH 10762) TaxID=717646 RepID=M2N4G0_BAUPA|nr:uncharacterized protein BAUCODRAFT_26843 [Baudoinia panamericana UAMH 10762]EMC93590.1 hypothetical protein BAUCODRAFT_26843 [Baudoinia panamericana UAMH 10762]